MLPIWWSKDEYGAITPLDDRCRHQSKARCDFLITECWCPMCPITHRFEVIADYCSKLGRKTVTVTLRFRGPFDGLRGNVHCLSLAHWKARNGLPIRVNWTFFARCYGWGATSDYLFQIGDFAPMGAGWPKNLGRWGCPPPTILLVRKLS